MRISPPTVVAVVLSFAGAIGAGCSGGTIDTSGVGGAPDPSTGDFPQLDVAVGSVGSFGEMGGFGPGVPPPAGNWLNRYGEAEDQHITSLGSNSAGEIAVTGTAKGTINFGNIPWTGTSTDTDVVVAKISNAGQALWSRRFGDSCDQHGGAAAVSSTGLVAVAGDFCGKMDFGVSTLATKGVEIDAFIAVLDTFGEDLYSRSFGGKGAQIARGLAMDASGNAVLVGSFDGGFDDGTGEVASAGLDDAFVIKLDPKGNVLWSLTLGGPEADVARGVALDTNGNIVIGGNFAGNVDFGAGPLTAAPGHGSGFVLALDPGGKALWSKSFGGDEDVVVNGVAASSKGTLAATGSFLGTVDFGSGPATSAGAEDAFLAMMDSTGAPIWGRTIGLPATQRATGVAFGTNGDVLLSGTSDETIDLSVLDKSIVISSASISFGPNSVYAVRYDTTGKAVTAQVFNSAQPIASAGVGFDDKFGTILAGSFQGNIAFQFGSYEGQGGWDTFVAREW
jgi:hypothetical protein